MRRLLQLLSHCGIWIVALILYQNTAAKSEPESLSRYAKWFTLAPPALDQPRIDLTRLKKSLTRVAATPSATTPTLSLGTLSTFTWEVGAPIPGPQSLGITSSPASTAFNVTPTGGWLSVTPSSGQTPAKLQVSLAANAANFSVGRFPGAVSVAAPAASNSPQVANVDLVVVPRIVLPSFPLVGATVGSPYVQILNPLLGVGPYKKWTLSKGSLPSGLTLSPTTGVISGFPTSAAGGPFQFSVQATDSLGVISDPANYTIGVTEPGLTVSPVSLAFSARPEDRTLPDPQTLSAFSQPNGISFTAATDGSTWLSVSSGGITPGQVKVSVNPAGLGPGNHQGSITLLSQANLKNIIPVTVTVSRPSAPPHLLIHSPAIQVAAVQGQAPLQKVISVSNDGAGILNFTVGVSGGSWLNVPSLTGSVASGQTASVPFTIDVSGQDPGTYTGAVTITNADNGDSSSIPVAVTVSSQERLIHTSQSGLRFTAVVGGGAIAPQSFTIQNPGQGNLDWAIDVQRLSGGSGWLQVDPLSGSSAAGAGGESPVTVTVSPTSLAPGQYAAILKIRADGASNSPQSVTVAVNVLRPGDQGSGPQFSESGLLLIGQNGSLNGPSSLLVYNPTGKALTYTSVHESNDPQDWLGTITSSGTVSAGAPVRIPVQVNLSGLAPGVRNGVVKFAFSDGTVRTVDVTSLVLPAPASQTGDANLSPAGSGCSARGLVLAIASPSADSIQKVAQSESVRVNATDDCGNPMTAGAINVAFSNGDADLPLRHQGNGVWTGTWTPHGAGLNVRLAATAFSALPAGIFVSAQKGVQVLVLGAPDNASATVKSIVNSASFAVSPVTPGSWISIFGDQLSTSSVTADSPTPALGDTQVYLGQTQLALNYVSGGQVNAMIPYGLTSDTVHNMLILRSATASVPIDITVADVQPGIYSVDSSGSGQGSIYNAATGNLADPFNPVTAGDYVTIACAGLGRVDQPPPTGSASPADPLARTLLQPGVTIGGVTANVSFSGLQPGVIGVYQVNAVVPDGITPGQTVPVQLTAVNAVSNIVTISVR
jgi:uncharacterized protein (TIGR03437 family)